MADETYEFDLVSNTSSCGYSLKHDYWDEKYMLRSALYNLSVPCYLGNHTTEDGIYTIEAPSTFFIQILRLSVAICFVILILALYNSIEVLGKIVFSIASCSIQWIVFLCLIALKSIILLVLLPILHGSGDHKSYTLDAVGFISTNLLQLITVFVLYICLEHEHRFRSPEYAAVASPISSSIPTEIKKKLCFNWPRAFAGFFALVSLLILISLASYSKKILPGENDSELYNCTHKEIAAFTPMVWVWILSLFKVRMCVFSMGFCLLCSRNENLRLTIAAKIYLSLGLLFSIFEDIPNSIVTVIAFKTYKGSNHVCFGEVFTIYDVMQVLGIFSLIFLVLFVRSQYLRVEQESKLSVLGEMQRLLQVNGRRDVVSVM